jgi:hypothetical protein
LIGYFLTKIGRGEVATGAWCLTGNKCLTLSMLSGWNGLAK